MAKTIRLASNLELPLDAVTQTFGFIAQKRYGKTYAAGVLAERLHAAGAPVVILDPVGTWWGLRLGADGKSKGLPIPVFGGLHGDISLTPESGRLVAHMILEKYISAVLDVSGFRKAERDRFVADFAEELFHRAKSKLAPIMLFLEEAQKFVPQFSKGKERLVGAIEDIVRLGGNYGIGASMITQRPQSVNKEVLNQVEALFVGKLNGQHERKAVGEWIVEKGIDETVAALPKMKKGEFYFWSPSWVEMFVKVQIARKKTFDSSATPELGKKYKARKLAPVDIDELKGAFAETLEKQARDDPRILHRRIAELEKQLRGKGAQVVEKRVEVPVERHVEVAAVGKMEILRLEQAAKKLKTIAERFPGHISNVLGKFEAQFECFSERVEKEAGAVLVGLGKAGAPSPQPRRSPLAVAPKRSALGEQRRGTVTSGDGELALRSGEKRILQMLAQQNPVRRTRAQTGTLSGFTPSGGTFQQYFGKLKREGLIEEQNDEVGITEAGLTFLGSDVPAAPATTGELQQMWRERLRRGEAVMLDILIKTYPRTLTREVLGYESGFTYTGGTFQQYLGTLVRNGLVEKDGELVRASDMLFTIGG